MTRIKCSVLDRNKEKLISRIATRGVVKFFNVCNQEQKEIETKLNTEGTSERKRDKILGALDKGSFLDRLKENDSDDDEPNQSDEENEPKWSVLKDSFIMGGKMKNWDKNVDEQGVPIDDENTNEEKPAKSKNKKFKKVKRPSK